MSSSYNFHANNSNKKASTLASWSNLPGKSLLIDQLAKLKAKSSAPSSCNKCKCCQANNNNNAWEEAFYVPQQQQQQQQQKSSTLKKQHLKKKNKSEDWLNLNIEPKSVRFRLPQQHQSPPTFHRQFPQQQQQQFQPHFDLYRPRTRRSYSHFFHDVNFNDEQVFQSFEYQPHEKSSVIVKSSQVKPSSSNNNNNSHNNNSEHSSSTTSTLTKKGKSLFSHRFTLGNSEKVKKSPPASLPVQSEKSEKSPQNDGKMGENGDKSNESDPGYESDPANSAAAALLALQEACCGVTDDLQQQQQQHSFTVPYEEKSLTLNNNNNAAKKFASSSSLLKKFTAKMQENHHHHHHHHHHEDEVGHNSSPLPITMRLFSPVRVRLIYVVHQWYLTNM